MDRDTGALPASDKGKTAIMLARGKAMACSRNQLEAAWLWGLGEGLIRESLR